MSNENTLETKKPSDGAATPATPKPSAGQPSQDRGRAGGARSSGPGGRGPGRGGSGPGRGGRPRRPRTNVPAESDYEEKNLEIARVTRVTKGGKRMRFRALSVIGNRKGRVGFGLAKGTDVAGATTKAMAQARKALLTVPIVDETIPHVVRAKFGAAIVLLKPAPKGTGIKAGGAVRTVLELAGVPNIVSKIMGSNNKTNNVKATFEALRQLRAPKATSSSKPEEKKVEEKAA
ncbi:30S ribosomal protein S5 [Candidatus Uhrbacteria bacterium CG22_combo_CG10-13_8_21_14_all_47_17]|uniref:Small ribosomal subunit protein uS5 n=1 Tax=Candidatus Uhrbacteria bacterium CG22_combo_CG10-13_8_21_14_all_47_17 TaxID=1975041 RepID=A0A2H0BTN2_9BACT|nr:MAG: 30S ribosomal protein S5 [Candidatus Uhrbacteria bacterium CG22_combo_CG10-13_8_21_14_all_47_17]